MAGLSGWPLGVVDADSAAAVPTEGRDRTAIASVTVAQPAAWVVALPADAVRGVFDKDTAFARSVVAELALRYRGLVKDLKNQRLRTGLERLANWILAHNQQLGAPGSFKLPIEKRALASLLGMRPEHLSRSFGELADLGVTVDGAKVTIRDMAALTKFAGPDPLIDGPMT